MSSHERASCTHSGDLNQLSASTAQDEPVDLVGDFLGAGWGRWLPLVALDVLMAIQEAAATGGDVADPATGPANKRISEEGGLGMSAFVGEEEDPTDDDGETLRMRRDGVAAVARALGASLPGTLADVVDLMCKLHIIEKQESGGRTRWSVSKDIPSVLDLPLPEKERRKEERVQWQGRYYPLSQEIIALFLCGNDAPFPPPGFQRGGARATLHTTLALLGTQLGAVPEDVREAIAVLENEGDFSCTPNVRRLTLTDPLSLVVDWRKFDEGRMGFSINPEVLGSRLASSPL